MNNTYLCLALITNFILIGVYGIELHDCGSAVGKFTKIEVSGCDTTKPYCVLRKNTNVTIGIDFELTKEQSCDEVNTVVHGIIMKAEIPFPLRNPNGCVNSGITCPITKDKAYEYTATLPILKQYPKLRVDVKWELRNERSESIICVIIPAKIE